MNAEINLVPYWTEDGLSMCVTIRGMSNVPLSKEEIADALREYAAILENQEDVLN